MLINKIPEFKRKNQEENEKRTKFTFLKKRNKIEI